MRTAIMTDTNSGISVDEGKKLGIYVLPMPVIIDDQEYMEGVNIRHEELYRAMDEGKEIHTSQPSPGEVTAMWDQILADGASELVYIPMSSGLSGSCATARMLAEEYEGKVQVVDNHRISITQRSSVLDARYLSEQRKSALAIREQLEKNAFDASIYISVNTVKYLKKSNRITAAGASLAAAIDLRPVLNIRGGKLDAQCVCRGEKHTQKMLIKLMEHDLEKRFRFITPNNIILQTSGSYTSAEAAEEWTHRVQKAFPDYQVSYQPLSCSIACHVGADSVAIAMAIAEH